MTAEEDMKHLLSYVGYMALDCSRRQQLSHWSVNWLRACRRVRLFIHCRKPDVNMDTRCIEIEVIFKENTLNWSLLVYYKLMIQWFLPIQRTVYNYQHQAHHDKFLQSVSPFSKILKLIINFKIEQFSTHTHCNTYVTLSQLFRYNFCCWRHFRRHRYLICTFAKCNEAKCISVQLCFCET